MFIPKKIFILENGKQKEISFKHFLYLKENDKSFKFKKFVGVNGMIFEAEPQKYKEFYKYKRRKQYIEETKEELGISVVSYNTFDTDDFLGESVIADTSRNFTEIVEEKIMNEKLHESISMLSPTEKYIINSLYFNNATEDELAEILGVAQTTISYRKRKALRKLAKILGN